MRHLTCYLAGGIDRDNPWRQKVIESCKDFPIEFYIPDEKLLYTTQGMAQAHKHDDSFDVIDLLKVEACLITFAFFSTTSKSRFSGTTYECAHAIDIGRRVIAVCDMKPAKRHFYAFVLRQITREYKTLEEGIVKLQEWAQSFQPVPRGEL